MPRDDVSNSLRKNAKLLRRNMPPAERKLWQVLRAHRLEGIPFRRQMPIAGYIVDFAAPRHRVIVELDGSQHAEIRAVKQDELRDRTLARTGWATLRFWNIEVHQDLDSVCRKILAACGKVGS